MTTVHFGYSPGAFALSQRGMKWFETGVAADLTNAIGYTLSNIFGRPVKPITVEEFMYGDVSAPTPFGSSLPLILAGGVVLIVVAGMFMKK